MRHALSVIAAIAVLIAPSSVRADDVGSRRDIRAIRHDLPTILGNTATPVDDVVVDGTHAIVRVGKTVRGLEHIYDRWWDVESDYQQFPAPIRALAAEHISAFAQLSPPLESTGTLCDPGAIDSRASVCPITTSGHYRMQAHFAPSDAAAGARFAILGRRPSENESWTYRTIGGYGNAYFFFSLTLQSPSTLHIGGGSTIDVHFPFALDPTYRYSITLANAQPVIGPIDGTLHENTLHFVLPAFAAAPNADLMGEIDGDPH